MDSTNGNSAFTTMNSNQLNAANSVNQQIVNNSNSSSYVKTIPTSPIASSLRVIHQKHPIYSNSNLNLNSNSNSNVNTNSLMMIAAAQAIASATSSSSSAATATSQHAMHHTADCPSHHSVPDFIDTLAFVTATMAANGKNNQNINNLNSDSFINHIDDSGVNYKHFINGMNLRILASRYLITRQVTGSSSYECCDIFTKDKLYCKVMSNSYSKILSAYYRMDGNPCIKPLYKILQSTDRTYLLMSQTEFGDLHSHVRERKRLSEIEARKLFRQICKTVATCHQQGIVLRDLKLRKFVFTDPSRTQLQFESLEDVVVLDDPDDDLLTEKIGCPAYVAPEILKPNSDFSGKAADLWSLGVILYTMLIGRYPFNDPEHSSLFAKISRCQFTVPEFLSPKARCLIRSLLQKVPSNRITSDDLLYHPWLQETDADCYSSPMSPNVTSPGSFNSNLIPTTINSSGIPPAPNAFNSHCTDRPFCDDQVVPDIKSFSDT